MMSQGCLRPLLFSAGALLILGLLLVFSYRDTVSLMLTNMQAMGEGAAAARALRSPDDVVAYLAAHPESTSLVAFGLDQPETGLFHQADTPRPTAGLSRLLLLAAYARQVTDGTLTPDDRIPFEAVDRYHLAGIEQGAHDRAVQYLRTLSATTPDTITLADLVAAVVRTKDPGASDLLFYQLSRTHSTSPSPYPGLAAPLPHSGLFLSWMLDPLAPTPEERLATFRTLSPDSVASLAYRHVERYVQDGAYRQRVTEHLTQRGTDLSLPQQRGLAKATFPQGTARAFATFFSQVLTDSRHTADASRLIRHHLEGAMTDSARVVFARLGTEGGAFPGLISLAGYAQRAPDTPPRVVVLLLEDLPMGVFYHLLQTGLDKALFVQLLADDAFLRRTHARLQLR